MTGKFSKPIARHGNLTAAQHRGRQVFFGALAITVGFSGLVLVGLIALNIDYSMESIDHFIAAAKPWLQVWRLVLFLILIGAWSQWTERYARWAGLNGAQRLDLLTYRWRMALWLLVMEAVLAQGILVDFVDQLLASMESES